MRMIIQSTICKVLTTVYIHMFCKFGSSNIVVNFQTLINRLRGDDYKELKADNMHEEIENHHLIG